MEEFEPKRKKKIITKEFISRNIYVLVLAVLLLGGITYGYTFFIQNKKITSGSISLADLTINFTDRNINATGLSVPTDDQEGLTEYTKSLTISNTTNIDGRVNLTLERTSGLNLENIRYAIIINGAIQEIEDVPASGQILSTSILGNETLNVEVRLWPKSGSTTTFVGEIKPEIKYLGNKATTSIDNPAGKYVNFNCNGSTCEVWQIVKVEDGRLVLTRQADYTNATSRTNSNIYNPASFNPAITFNDDSLISSLSTDGLNVYLAKTVKVESGSGTQQDPYILTNTDFREGDKKVLAIITYKDGTTTLGTQNVYYGETNYISRDALAGWSDGTNTYQLGDTVSFTTDTNLSLLHVQAVNLSFDNTITGFNCTDAQCALEELNNLIDPPICTRVTNVADLHTEKCTNTETSGGCQYYGYQLDEDITFGNARPFNTNTLTVGDAFDCDVNGNGIIDVDGNNKSTERFYYVSNYFDTVSKTFDNSYATLIYYTKYKNGAPVDETMSWSVLYTQDSAAASGPDVAVTHLPSTSGENAWRNDLLKTSSRTIYSCEPGDLQCTNPGTRFGTSAPYTYFPGNSTVPQFSYSGKAARLLTYNELIENCYSEASSDDVLLLSTNCLFLRESDIFVTGATSVNTSVNSYGIMLETLSKANGPGYWRLHGGRLAVSSRDFRTGKYSVTGGGQNIRPVIDVPISEIKK